jgi:AcrR family transcriptional regulator
MNNRDKNKAANRSKILESAKVLVQLCGIEALSMRALAELAEVSPRTPYNLFGSKTDLLLAMLDIPMKELARNMPLNKSKVLESSLDLLETAFALYAPAVDYYRKIYWGIMSSDNHDSRARSLESTKQFVLAAILQAQANGELEVEVDADLLANHLVVTIAGLLGLWASDLLTDQELTDYTSRSLGLCFLSCCTAKVKAQIALKIPSFTRKL